MSRFTNLAIALSLAACEHASPPQFPEQPAEAAPEPAPPTTEPAVAPVTQAPVPAPTAPAVTINPNDKKSFQKRCNPMSRAACRWVEDRDERELPRVIRKGEQVQ